MGLRVLWGEEMVCGGGGGNEGVVWGRDWGCVWGDGGVVAVVTKQ